MKVLLVDDNKESLYMLEAFLKGSGYEVVPAKNGIEALEKLKHNSIDSIISDILMPDMDGFQLCRACKQNAGLNAIPFIFYSAIYTDEKDMEFALSLGAEKFVVKPTDPDKLIEILEAVLEEKKKGPAAGTKKAVKEESVYLSEYNKRLVSKLETKVKELEKEIAERMGAEEALKQLLINTITSFASAIDAKSEWTRGHSERVTRYAVAIGLKMGLDDETIETLRLGGLLHDIGKIGTCDDVLDKPSKLSCEEFELLKKHPLEGAMILGPIKQLSNIIPMVKYHHERIDGEGYPEGLKGDRIPLLARILSVADTYDSMASDRPYRKSLNKEYAVSELKRYSGTQFDADIVETFLATLK